jgi:IPT/TIG domain-containing protein
MGSGFGAEQGPGYVAVGDAKAEVVSWNSTEIILIVPDSVIPGRVYKVSVHRNGQSQDFPMISFRE